MAPSRSIARRCALAALALALAAPDAAAQPGADEHAAHHPPKTATPAPAKAEVEGCCGGRAEPLLSRVLRLAPGDRAAREALAAESHARMQRGATLADQAAKEAQWAASMRDVATVRQAQARLHEADGQFQVGAAAHLALTQGDQASPAALNWFRGQMSLSEASASPGAGRWLGATPAHLVLMILLALIAASLVALQLTRGARARALLHGVGASGVGGPTVVAAAAPASMRDAPRARPQRWAGVLRVAQVFAETPTVSTFRLVAPDGDHLPFAFLPGQFLQVEVEPTPGSPARRSYTIASPPSRIAYVELTVKREAQGVVSAYLHDRVGVGDLLKVSGPFGTFTFTGTDADSIVLIAGGVGITPMISVLRYLTDLAWPGDIFFIYAARSSDEIVFRDEIARLERRHPNVHTLVVVDSQPDGTTWEGAEGRLTRELLQARVPDIGRRRIHLCGPPAMMTAIQGLLHELGVAEAQIRTEAFGPASLPAQEPAPDAVVPPPLADAKARTEVAPATVTFSVAGVSAALPAETTVLEAAERAGVEIPYACRAGVCGVCVVKLVRGGVRMAVEEGLDPADKAQGYVLACQAKSTGGDLVVEA